MSAFLIVHATITDMDKLKDYSESAALTLKTFGAEVMFKGKVTDILSGDHHSKMSIVIKFADQQTLNNWYHSKDYQALIPLRESAMTAVFISVEE